MKDREAINILQSKKINDINEFSAAVAHAGNRLIDCQWHDYVEDDPRIFGHMCGVWLDMEFEDGSRGTYPGHGCYTTERGFYFEVDRTSYLLERATIKHWMAIPKYRED